MKHRDEAANENAREGKAAIGASSLLHRDINVFLI